MNIVKYELFNDSTGEYIGSCAVGEQERHAARSYANRMGVPVKVIAHQADGSTLWAKYHPDGQIENSKGEIFPDPNDPRNYTVNLTILPGQKVVNMSR